MVSADRVWKLLASLIVLSSLIVFAYFIYAGESLTRGSSAGGPISPSINEAGVQSLVDYLYGVVVLFVGQLALLLTWFVRRRSSSPRRPIS